MTSASKGGFQPDSDVHITFEDQQKINKFARHNAKLEDFKDELKQKQNELKNLEEAADEIELLPDDKIPFLVGEIFVFQDQEKTQKCLEEAKQQIQKEIEGIEDKCSKLKEIMSDLKTQLYGKFGSHINLEAEEE
ncbi:probable prefoldin subunit 4 [Macrosteles quadrilineatus]|uniref:probable prefoldin subunit 4 n=1 Tax=Macrosteles quadrilineatus TaxID=74068 RepID=UPI0023E1FD89|nr:probable prefoldin subunit 4 [Macrosteles quadrilineatus]XP_054285574.1 probable prefoldin subunit 4 [Macrosteles quadrilineatus]